MTICNPALKTSPIPTCIGELTIGTTSLASTNILVHIQNITTGKINVYQTSSNGSGLVMIDLTEDDFSDKQSYELWITKPVEAAPQTITIAGESATAIALSFANCTENGESFELPQVTLELA